MSIPKSLYSLDIVTDEPPYESFALLDAPSVLGRDCLDDDITPGYEAIREWPPTFLKEKWIPPRVEGRVPEFQDFSALDFILPVFNSKACEILKQFLEPNGELLKIDSPKGDYYFYNVTNILDALNVERSKLEYLRKPALASDITYFSFNEDIIKNQSIFRFYEFPMMLVVSDKFVETVKKHNLTGFDFKKIWPLPEGTNWRDYTEDEDSSVVEDPKGSTVIVILSFSSSQDAECNQFTSKLEDSLDEVLAVKNIDDKCYGTQEGRDIVDNQYRIFFSCPNADDLIEHISLLLKPIKYAEVQVFKKAGGMFDEDALVEERKL